MLCLPAFMPVANDAHAVGDSGECVVCSGEKAPCFVILAMFGSLPSPIHFSSRYGSMPSKPRMISFWLNFDAGRRDEPEQAIETAAMAATARTRALVDFSMGQLRIISWRLARAMYNRHAGVARRSERGAARSVNSRGAEGADGAEKDLSRRSRKRGARRGTRQASRPSRGGR